MNLSEIKIAIVGLGYVGLPLAVEFGKQRTIIGFDINETRISELKNNYDHSGEISSEELMKARVIYTTDPNELKKANFIIVAVPTPIDIYKKPDLLPIVCATETIGKNLTHGTIIVYESTVFPGVTEDICRPILEKFSGLRAGVDFKLGYSPERTNPGDREHSIDKVIKIVSAEDAESLEIVADVYSTVCQKGVYRTEDIRTAEAAKVIENVQRDLNIAIVNELTLIFHRLGMKPREVLKAAGTKWNFHHYEPGLVGGHCIGVDPFYLTYLAESVGYNPQVILAGRRINDYMSDYVAEMAIKGLIEAGKPVLNAKILVLGLTFKENVSDTRNSKVKNVIDKLKEYGLIVYAHDPMLDEEAVKKFGVKNITDLKEDACRDYDGIILCVPHLQFKSLTLDALKMLMRGKPVIIDIKGLFSELAKNDKQLIYKSF